MGDTRDTSSTDGAPDEESRESADTISLLDILAILAIRWKLIFFTTFFAAIGVVLFSIYTIRMPADSRFNPLPNFYRPDAQILLKDPQSASGLSNTLSATDLGILSGLTGTSGRGESSAALAVMLLDGRQIVDEIVDEFGLLEVYAGSDFPREAARNAIRNGLGTQFDSRSGVMTVTFESVDPVFATDVLQRIVELLEERFMALTRDDARSRTVAIDAQLQQLEDDLAQARQALIDFQRRYGVIDPTEQGQQTLELIGRFRAQIFDLEIQRESVLQLVESDDDPQVQRIERQISLLEDLVDELETGFHVYSPISIPRDQIAALSAQYSDLQRDLLLKEQIYSSFQAELLKEQVTSQDTTPQFQVMEPPEVPGIKAGPSRGTLCVVVTVAAFLLSVFLAFIVEYFARAARDPGESRKLGLIREQFRVRRRRAKAG